MSTIGKDRVVSTRRGFALVAVLIVLVLVTVMVVGYLSIVRTERSASQNFNDQNSAESMAMGVLNRLMAEHAVPKINGKPLAPFLVDGTSANPTGLPTQDTVTNYFGGAGSIQVNARQALAPIYEIVPDDDTVFTNTGLVRVSKPSTGGTGGSAYDADFWAYDGITREVLQNAGMQEPTYPPQPPTNMVPQWVDYYEDDPATGQKKAYPTAKIAYAIWDEGGKLDVNMSGSDSSINGVAPHNLGIESALTTGSEQAQNLLNYLNNSSPGDGVRERSNFSLRRIAVTGSDTSLNDTGDDRWIFSIRELVEKNLVDPNKLRIVTAFSRDFDVRPEWDGDRASQYLRQAENRFQKFGSEDFLRSYVNNPDLFDLFYTANSAVDPDKIIVGTLNNATLQSNLLAIYPGLGGSQLTNWMQVMRFLAILRRATPPSGTEGEHSLDLHLWNNYDIWGTALNVLQATAPAADHNLFASNGSLGYTDPNSREGIRISPYVTAVSVKIKRAQTNPQDNDHYLYTATEYITLWNPFPFPILTGSGTKITYRAGSFVTGYQSGINVTKPPSGFTAVPDQNLMPAPIRDMWPAQVQDTGLIHPYPGGQSGNPEIETNSDSSKAVDSTLILPGHFYYVVIGPTTNVPGGTPANVTRAFSLNQLKNQTKFGVQNMVTTSGTPGMVFVVRDYVRNYDYYPLWDYNVGSEETVYYAVNMMMPYFDATNPSTHLWVYVPASKMPTTANGVYWYSFQIDDPRCGSFPRDVNPSTFITNANTVPAQQGADYAYSWWSYPGSFSIDFNTLKAQVPSEAVNVNDFKTGYNGKTFLVSGSAVAGFNANFGVNWPAATGGGGISSNDQQNFDLMMSTFGLPGRPFLNVGEVGNVFAERPWTTVGFANTISPLATGTQAVPVLPDDYVTSGSDAGNPPMRPSALLDYFTTVGTPTAATNLNFRQPDQNVQSLSGKSLPANVNQRYQEKAWLFDAVTGTNDSNVGTIETPTGNLRPIRGRINLNTATADAITALLSAPYRIPASIGVEDLAKGLNWTVTKVDGTQASDLWVTIDPTLAQQFASMIAQPVSSSTSIRPLRNMNDLSRIYDQNASTMLQMHKKYPSSIINAIFGRLAQFGTVRSQIYTVDLVVRALSPTVEQRRLSNPSLQSVVKSEVRVQALVYFDTFSRKSYIESIKYR